MCRAKGMNTLVMDVEGTDGRERGEDQDFERKSALFSLATAEVLLVNMWEHQVGLYQGGRHQLYQIGLALDNVQQVLTKTLRTSQHGTFTNSSRGKFGVVPSRQGEITECSQGQSSLAFRHP